MRTQRLQKRVEALEDSNILKGDNRWPPLDCDPKRRLARYASYFDGRPWECTGTPERKALNEVRMARYQKYFDAL